MAATGFLAPTTESVVSGSWTTLSNDRAIDAATAVGQITTATATIEYDAGSFGFSVGVIPDGSTISAVELRVKWAISSTTSARQEIQAFVSGAAVGAARTNTTHAPQSSLFDETFNITADRAWTAADFRDGTFKVRARVITTANVSRAGSWDYIAVQVTYTAPPTPVVSSCSPNNGTTAGGTAVTITGTGFTGTTAVTFGGTAATSVVVVNSTSITCVTPAHAAGLVSVAVTTYSVNTGSSNAYTYNLPAVTGTLAATETPDTASFAGTVKWNVVLAATEVADVAAFTGSVSWKAILAATEPPDVAAFTGSVYWKAVLGAVESSDTASFIGQLNVFGPLAATELPDTAGFAGTVEWRAVLAAVEQPDIAAFTGGIVGTGVLGATEAPDVAAFTGKVEWQAILAAIEASDIIAMSGKLINSGSLAAVESNDVAEFAGIVDWRGILAAVEERDTIEINALIGLVYEVECLTGRAHTETLAGLANSGVLSGRANLAILAGRETTPCP